MDLQVLILNVSTASVVSNPLEHSGERGEETHWSLSLMFSGLTFLKVLPVSGPCLKVHVFLLIIPRKWK